ncbi:MAG: CHAP domain-containing protein [Moraxella sp.]|nr:CHAP domain-containing protein [Moraxella sp.]
MKKAAWLLSMIGLSAAYSSTVSATEGRIFLSSGDRQVNMTYQAPVVSEDELNEAINRLTAGVQSHSQNYYDDVVVEADTDFSTSNAYIQPQGEAPKTLTAQSAPRLAAAAASRAAHGRSVGRCAMYVRRALQSAGYRFTPQASAYQYANGTLASAGFVKLSNDNYKPQVGDVAVFNRTSRNPHGHIQIYDGKQWVSDFRQSKFSPYSQHNGYTVWRDARYLDASSNGTYLALND